MASFICLARASAIAGLHVLLLGGCVGGSDQNIPAAPAGVLQVNYEANVLLPDGAGKTILEGVCLSCHDLSGLNVFKAFYRRENWRDLVVTMRANGAQLDPGQVETLADYLAEYFSP